MDYEDNKFKTWLLATAAGRARTAQNNATDKNPMPRESCVLRQKIRVGFRPRSPMAVARYN